MWAVRGPTGGADPLLNALLPSTASGQNFNSPAPTPGLAHAISDRHRTHRTQLHLTARFMRPPLQLDRLPPVGLGCAIPVSKEAVIRAGAP
jgi:hypothetical protein